MRWIVVLLAVIAALAVARPARADDLTTRQRVVVETIYQACDRYDLTDTECALPMYVAWRETRYGLATVGDNGRSQGTYQWYEYGLGSYGDYYARYGLSWRGNLWLDIDMGVRLLTSHLRGGPDYRAHWRAWTIGDWPGMPERD